MKASCSTWSCVTLGVRLLAPFTLAVALQTPLTAGPPASPGSEPIVVLYPTGQGSVDEVTGWTEDYANLRAAVNGGPPGPRTVVLKATNLEGQYTAFNLGEPYWDWIPFPLLWLGRELELTLDNPVKIIGETVDPGFAPKFNKKTGTGLIDESHTQGFAYWDADGGEHQIAADRTVLRGGPQPLFKTADNMNSYKIKNIWFEGYSFLGAYGANDFELANNVLRGGQPDQAGFPQVGLGGNFRQWCFFWPTWRDEVPEVSQWGLRGNILVKNNDIESCGPFLACAMTFEWGLWPDIEANCQTLFQENHLHAYATECDGWNYGNCFVLYNPSPTFIVRDNYMLTGDGPNPGATLVNGDVIALAHFDTGHAVFKGNTLIKANSEQYWQTSVFWDFRNQFLPVMSEAEIWAPLALDIVDNDITVTESAAHTYTVFFLEDYLVTGRNYEGGEVKNNRIKGFSSGFGMWIGPNCNMNAISGNDFSEFVPGLATLYCKGDRNNFVANRLSGSYSEPWKPFVFNVTWGTDEDGNATIVDFSEYNRVQALKVEPAPYGDDICNYLVDFNWDYGSTANIIPGYERCAHQTPAIEALRIAIAQEESVARGAQGARRAMLMWPAQQ